MLAMHVKLQIKNNQIPAKMLRHENTMVSCNTGDVMSRSARFIKNSFEKKTLPLECT